jgi:predicted DNA-binding transcriptional regulator AlpA
MIKSAEGGRKVTVETLCRLWGLKESWVYERSRKDALPGAYRCGRLLRIDLDEFEAAV